MPKFSEKLLFKSFCFIKTVKKLDFTLEQIQIQPLYLSAMPGTVLEAIVYISSFNPQNLPKRDLVSAFIVKKLTLREMSRPAQVTEPDE